MTIPDKATIEALFIRGEREGGYTFVTAPKFPGFSLMLEPNEDDARLNAAFIAFLSYEFAALSRPAPAAEVTGERKRIREAIYNWLWNDAPAGAKASVMTEHIDALENRLAIATPSPDAGRVPVPVKLLTNTTAMVLNWANVLDECGRDQEEAAAWEVHQALCSLLAVTPAHDAR